tara:strand:- start:1644 stop:2135 length:492 start_codon:yes stop_codon:yes gene_type:complete
MVVILKQELIKRLEYGNKKETEFMCSLNETINDTNISITKTIDKFCCVDYKVKNEVNKKCIYLELKSRKDDISKFNTLLIGKDKLNKISNYYNKFYVLLIWYDECKNMYITIYNDDLLKSPTNNLFTNSFDIDKSCCKKSDMKNLSDGIKKLLSAFKKSEPKT